MKYIKNFENILESDDINKLTTFLSSGSGKHSEEYLKQVINHYNMTDDEVHNLRLAVEYGYLYYSDFRTVVSDIITFGYVWTDKLSERKFKFAYEFNFKNKINYFKSPYIICTSYRPYNNESSDINSFDFDEIIGEIPKEYPFGKKYLIGKGRYRGEYNNDETLWEEYLNTKRESEYIKVLDEDKVFILTDDDINNINMRKNAKKFNI